MQLKPFAEVFPAANVRHHFVGQDAARGVYAKELHIPAGFMLVSHSHPYDHLSILAAGVVTLTRDGVLPAELRGPCAVTVAAGVEHALHAITDAVWFCIHPTPTDATDADQVDAAILQE